MVGSYQHLPAMSRQRGSAVIQHVSIAGAGSSAVEQQFSELTRSVSPRPTEYTPYSISLSPVRQRPFMWLSVHRRGCQPGCQPEAVWSRCLAPRVVDVGASDMIAA